MSLGHSEQALIQKMKNLTFSINMATEEIKHYLKNADHPTTHYIWRTRGDGKVRSRHAKFNGKVFSWNNPPEGGYHPGEDYGCRCWAEPYQPKTEKLQEQVSQIVTSAINDKLPAWTREDFFNHYHYGKYKMVRLSEIGHLQNIIDHARTYDQGGGSIFEKVEKDIFEKARQNGEGSFPYHFRRSYEFQPAVFEIGGATVAGAGNVKVTKKGRFLIISVDLIYTFSDVFTDPYDYGDIIPGEFNPFGNPYHITDRWSTKIEAIIKE